MTKKQSRTGNSNLRARPRGRKLNEAQKRITFPERRLCPTD